MLTMPTLTLSASTGFTPLTLSGPLSGMGAAADAEPAFSGFTPFASTPGEDIFAADGFAGVPAGEDSIVFIEDDVPGETPMAEPVAETVVEALSAAEGTAEGGTVGAGVTGAGGAVFPVARLFASSEGAPAAPVPAAGGEAAALGFWNWGASSRWPVQTVPVQEVTYTASDFMGEGQTIVIIDDGYSSYYDQSNTVWSYDLSGLNDPDANNGSLYSHGDWVAQSALEEAPEANIVHLKVFADEGGGASLTDIEQALDLTLWLTNFYDIAAVNLSLGYGNATTETMTSLSDEFAELDELGVTTVVAAGNSGTTYDDGVNVLAADPNVVAVSATDASDELASFSQSSDTLTDVAALGVDKTATTVYGSTVTVSGTSFAAPEVSGTAARLEEASLELLDKEMTDEVFLDILDNSGREVQGEDADYVVADGDAAVEYFLDNLDYYDQLLLA